MYSPQKIKIALIAGALLNFSDKGPTIYTKYQEDLQKLSKELNFELTVYRNLIMTEQKAVEIREDIDKKDFDFVLLFHPICIIGDIVFELMKTKVYLGIWAIEESTKEGPLPNGSFVSMNINTSIAGHCFKDARKKFKWFFGSIDNKYFKPRFEITVKVLTAIKNLKDSKVAQIGKVMDGFRNMYYDERAIYKTFGIDVVRGIEVEDVLAEAEKLEEKMIKREVNRICSKFSEIKIKDEKIIDSVKIFLATKKICQENNFKAVAFDCGPKLIKLKNMVGCLSNSMLNSIGIVASCEGDMLSTVSMLILRLLSGLSPAVMDLPVFDTNDESILVWHCGSAPLEMANTRGVVCRKHFRADFANEQEFENLGPVADMIYPESDVSVFRLTRESDYFYYFTGRMFNEGKKSWDGSRGWINNLKLYGKPIKVIDLINTILLNNIQHHYPILLRDVSKYIEEFAYWLDLKKEKKIDYSDSLYV